jgi:hypothetical protein
VNGCADIDRMQLLCRPHPHPLRHRLWLVGTWLGLVVATAVVMLAGARNGDGSKLMSLGGDFVPAYAAGTLVREGRAIAVYNQTAVGEIERRVVREADLEPLPFYGPYLNPPFLAAAYAPLSALPYRTAAAVWLGINLACVAGAIALLIGMLPIGTGWRAWGLVPLLILISMPFWQSICHLQNTCVSLLLVCGVVACWRAEGTRRAVFGGMMCGLLFYKPQLGLVIAGMFCLTRGWRVAVGCAMTGGTLMLLTLARWPGTLTAYLHQLPIATAEIQSRPVYNWGRQVTLRGFWRLAIQGHAGGADWMAVKVLTGLGVLAGLAALGWVLWSFVRRNDELRSADRVIAASIAAMPLLMPYYMDYDLLLLAVPAVLLAAEWIAAGRAPLGGDRGLVMAWAALFVVLYLNPGVSGPTRFNFAAALIAIVAGMTISRSMAREVTRCAIMAHDSRPMGMAA